MRAVRAALAAAGLALMAVGGLLLLDARRVADPWDVAVWLGGAAVVHDAVLVPLVLLAGAVTRARGAVRAGLVAAGSVTLVALPVLLRPGRPANPSVLPLDYPRNWLLVLAAVAVGTGAAVAGRRLRPRLRRRARAGLTER